MATFFERWKFADYFELLKQRKKNINAKCEVCPGNKHFSSHLSNLSKHLQQSRTNLRLVTAKDAWTQPSSQGFILQKKYQQKWRQTGLQQRILWRKCYLFLQWYYCLSETYKHTQLKVDTQHQTEKHFQITQCSAKMDTDLKKKNI